MSSESLSLSLISVCKGEYNVPIRIADGLAFSRSEKVDPHTRLEIVKKLIADGADVNYVHIPPRREFESFKIQKQYYSNYNSALYYASKNNYLDIVKILVENGCDPNERSSWSTPFVIACENGNLEIVKYFVETIGVDVNYSFQTDYVPFVRACKGGYLEVVKYLVEKGADVNTFSYNYHPPVTLAAKYGHLEVVKYLIEKGASIKPPMELMDPLTMALEKGHFEIAEYISYGKIQKEMGTERSSALRSRPFGSSARPAKLGIESTKLSSARSPKEDISSRPFERNRTRRRRKSREVFEERDFTLSKNGYLNMET